MLAKLEKDNSASQEKMDEMGEMLNFLQNEFEENGQNIEKQELLLQRARNQNNNANGANDQQLRENLEYLENENQLV